MFRDINGPGYVVDMWRHMSQSLKHLMTSLGDKISHFLPSCYVREAEEEKSKTSFDDPRSSVSRNLSRQELKFIASTRATHVYQIGRISLKMQWGIFGEIKIFGLRRCS